MNTKKKSKTETSGRRINLSLYQEDIFRILQLVAFVAEEGNRVSSSLIIRAALRAADRDQRFLAAYKRAASAEQRFKGESVI